MNGKNDESIKTMNFFGDKVFELMVRLGKFIDMTENLSKTAEKNQCLLIQAASPTIVSSAQKAAAHKQYASLSEGQQFSSYSRPTLPFDSNEQQTWESLQEVICDTFGKLGRVCDDMEAQQGLIADSIKRTSLLLKIHSQNISPEERKEANEEYAKLIQQDEKIAENRDLFATNTSAPTSTAQPQSNTHARMTPEGNIDIHAKLPIRQFNEHPLETSVESKEPDYRAKLQPCENVRFAEKSMAPEDRADIHAKLTPCVPIVPYAVTLEDQNAVTAEAQIAIEREHMAALEGFHALTDMPNGPENGGHGRCM